MAEKSFQNEIPPSRVNIRYVKYTGGAQEQIELPLKLLMLGDYTGRPDDTPLAERKKISINKDNFEAVLKEQKLKLDLVVPNRLSGKEGDEMKVGLSLDSLKDFNPDEIAQKVPELAKLLEVRKLLIGLRAHVMTNRDFRLQLEKIVRDDTQREAILKELEKITPMSDDVTGAPK
jgi:type VI secretion system protein ImpB